MAPRNEFLRDFRPGYRVPLRDPIGLATWLESQLKILRDKKLREDSKRRASRGRPPALNLRLLSLATGISAPVVSRLLTPARPGTKRNRFVQLGTLRRLERLPEGGEVWKFILTPKDQARLEAFRASSAPRLSEREAILWKLWEESNQGTELREFLRKLRSRGFSEREIAEWRRWMMRPFVSNGTLQAVARSWEELSGRERQRYLRSTTKCVEEILARRNPDTVRILEAAASLDKRELYNMLASLFGASESSPLDSGKRALALLDEMESGMASITKRLR